MKRIFGAAVLSLVLGTAVCEAQVSPAVAATVQREITPLLADQLAAANAHDTDRFLASYWRSPELVFAFNGTVINGYDAVRAQQLIWWKNGKADVAYSYVGAPEFRVLGPTAAVMTEKIESQRTLPSGAKSTGEAANTIVWQKLSGEWKVVQVHESTAAAAH